MVKSTITINCLIRTEEYERNPSWNSSVQSIFKDAPINSFKCIDIYDLLVQLGLANNRVTAVTLLPGHLQGSFINLSYNVRPLPHIRLSIFAPTVK